MSHWLHIFFSMQRPTVFDKNAPAFNGFKSIRGCHPYKFHRLDYNYRIMTKYNSNIRQKAHNPSSLLQTTYLYNITQFCKKRTAALYRRNHQAGSKFFHTKSKNKTKTPNFSSNHDHINTVYFVDNWCHIGVTCRYNG